MTLPQVTNQINTQLAGFATQTQANSLLSGLATPAWIQSQEANYIPATQIELANGPVALSSVTNQVAPGLINATTTQTWPHPFWSPANYNAATVTATTTPQQLYPLAIADPGYPYVVFCTGMVDTTVSADNGTYAQVLVNVGSATGPTIAQGNGNAESYTGPGPGDLTAQAFLSGGSGQPGGWSTIPSWTAFNGTGFTSTVISDYLQVPTTMTATLVASVNFAGANGGLQSGFGGIYNPVPQSQIRIINSAGTVIAYGGVVGGNSGTCTVSWTGSLVAGQLYTIQGDQWGIGGGFFGNGAGNYGAWQSGTFTINPSVVQMSSMANIIPVPFAAQTPITGPTTLYVMLASSNNSTAVSASTFDPGLWVMPLPWA
jgi:hypothetical protein